MLLRLVLSRARAAQLATSVLTKVLSRVCRVAALALRAKSGFYVADRTLVFAAAALLENMDREWRHARAARLGTSAIARARRLAQLAWQGGTKVDQVRRHAQVAALVALGKSELGAVVVPRAHAIYAARVRRKWRTLRRPGTPCALLVHRASTRTVWGSHLALRVRVGNTRLQWGNLHASRARLAARVLCALVVPSRALAFAQRACPVSSRMTCTTGIHRAMCAQRASTSLLLGKQAALPVPRDLRSANHARPLVRRAHPAGSKAKQA